MKEFADRILIPARLEIIKRLGLPSTQMALRYLHHYHYSYYYSYYYYDCCYYYDYNDYNLLLLIIFIFILFSNFQVSMMCIVDIEINVFLASFLKTLLKVCLFLLQEQMTSNCTTFTIIRILNKVLGRGYFFRFPPSYSDSYL
jgi:hypothetical protein